MRPALHRVGRYQCRVQFVVGLSALAGALLAVAPAAAQPAAGGTTGPEGTAAEAAPDVAPATVPAAPLQGQLAPLVDDTTGTVTERSTPADHKSSAEYSGYPPFDPHAGRTQRILGAVAIGAGFFSLTGATALGFHVAGNRENELLYCGALDGECADQLGLVARDRRKAGTVAAYALLGVGVALVVTGILALATAPSARARRSPTAIRLTARGIEF
jgi:hypothetical protein